MSRRFLTPIELPGDPGLALEAAPKRYVDKRGAPTGGGIGMFLAKTGPADHEMAWAMVPTPAGIVDCSAMTTVAQVNAAALAAPQGSIIALGPRSSVNPLLIDDTLLMRPYQRLLGNGGRQQGTCVKASAAFPAGKPIIAAVGYMNNQTSADNPVSVMGIHIDVNSKVSSHGLVVYNYWSHFEDVQIANVSGSAAHGIHQTDRGVDGSTVSTNSHSENTFVRCRFMDHQSKASGFWAESTNGLNNSNQDGHLKDCFFASIGGYGVRIGRAAGWTIDNNHLYGIGYDGISLDYIYATKITNNYIEDFGGDDGANNGAAPTYGYYQGISLGTVLDTRGSVMSGNTVSTAQPSSPTGVRWTCFYARAGSGQNLANLTCFGNTATWASTTAPATSRTWAFRFGEGGDTGRMLNLEYAANQIQNVAWWQGTRYVAATTVTINEPATSAALALKADDSATVHRTGDESVAGIKTFTGTVIFNLPPQVAVGTLAYHPVRRDDARLTDTRDPKPHKASHATGQPDALAPADIGAVAVARAISAGTGLSGGGDLSADRSFAVAYGTTAGTAVQGNDTRLGADQAAGTASPRTLGTGALQAAPGNDGRFTGDQAAGTASPRTLGTGALQAAPGNHQHDATIVSSYGTIAAAGTMSINAGAVPSGAIHRATAGGSTMTIAVPSAPTDGDVVNIEILASVATTITVAAAIQLTTGLTATPAVAAGKRWFAALRYNNPAGAWFLLAATTQQ